MAANSTKCLGCSSVLAAADYQPGSDQPKVCAACLSTMTPAERALRYENARIIYFLNAADINAEHKESEQIPVARLAKAIERLTAEIRQRDIAESSPPKKF